MNLGIFYTALSGLAYGTIGYFGVRLSEIGLTVSDLLFWRFAFSCILLLPILLMSSKSVSSSNYRAIGICVLIGIVFYGFGTGLYFESARFIGTGLGMVVFFTYPLFVVLLSLLFHHQKPSRRTLIALGLILTGCLLIALGKQDEFKADLWGIFLAAASGLGYAFYIFASKSVRSRLPELASTFWVCFGSSITFVIEAGLQNHTLYWPESPYAWTLIFGFALIGTVLPIFLFLLGIKTLSASQASIISVIEPVSVLVVGMVVLGESVTNLQLAGAVTILSSAWCARRDSNP